MNIDIDMYRQYHLEYNINLKLQSIKLLYKHTGYLNENKLIYKHKESYINIITL